MTIKYFAVEEGCKKLLKECPTALFGPISALLYLSQLMSWDEFIAICDELNEEKTS